MAELPYFKMKLFYMDEMRVSIHERFDSMKQYFRVETKCIFGNKMYFAPPIDYDKVMKNISYDKVIIVGKILFRIVYV